MATEDNDRRHVAEALENLAGQSAAMGDLPDALQMRERLEQMHRAQQDVAALGYDLVNRAELLIRLGRRTEADTLLNELTSGAAAGNDAFERRLRRAMALKALSAATAEDFPSTAALAADVVKESTAADSTRDLAAALLAYSEGRLRRHASAAAALPLSGLAPPPLARELRYYRAAARLARADAAGALGLVGKDLSGAALSYELEWRMAALGAAAARHLKDETRARELAARADRARLRLRTAWGRHAASYEGRFDLITLRREAGLNSRS
jgi:hypothetical protein